jgi:ferredoxin
MAHHVHASGYHQLADRLNRFPQGAPPGETLYKILSVLFSEREAELVSVLPIKPFTAGQAASVWKVDESAARSMLDSMADKALLLDTESGGKTTYVLPPPMAGFFEFSLMRIRGDIDQKALSELFCQYLNVEEDFVRELFTGGETQMGRAFVHEPALSEENQLKILDYERASEVIKTASHRGVGICYCRHKMLHVGRNCDKPLEICMSFNGVAESLSRHGFARLIDTEECLQLLENAYELGLVQFGENVRERVSFICNCCSCCCEAMTAARKFGFLHPVHTTGFIPVIDRLACTGCGKCVSACPVEALSLVSAHDPKKPSGKKSVLDISRCLGCGVCTRACPGGKIKLESRGERVLPPLNSVHRIVMMAIERGKLQNLLFDNQVLFSHRILASVLGAILKLPPVKQALASRQVKSRYLEALIARKSS